MSQHDLPGSGIARPGQPSDGGSAPAPLPRGVLVVLGAAGTVIAVSGMRTLDWMLGPVFLALVLVVAVSPVQAWMLRRRLPRWLATITVLLILYAILIVLVLVVAISVSQLAALLPNYAGRASELAAAAQAQLAHYGVKNTQIQSLLGQMDLGRITTVVTTVLSSLTSTFTTLFFLLTTMLFMGLDGAGFPERLRGVASVRPSVVTALSSFARGTRRYLVVSGFFGLICSALDIAALTWLGVPLPVLWGVLAFITNYIPNIGFFVGLVPPALLALLDGGPKEMLLVIVAYMAINLVIQTLIQPKFVGDVVGLSVTVTFLAVAFWTWVLGPLGALLAIPLTLLVKALLIDADPSTHWLDTLLGSGVHPHPAARSSAGTGRGWRIRAAAAPAAAPPAAPKADPETEREAGPKVVGTGSDPGAG